MPQRQHWGLRSIDSRKLLDQASSVTALGLTIIVAHIVDLEAQSPTLESMTVHKALLRQE